MKPHDCCLHNALINFQHTYYFLPRARMAPDLLCKPLACPLTRLLLLELSCRPGPRLDPVLSWLQLAPTWRAGLDGPTGLAPAKAHRLAYHARDCYATYR